MPKKSTKQEKAKKNTPKTAQKGPKIIPLKNRYQVQGLQGYHQAHCKGLEGRPNQGRKGHTVPLGHRRRRSHQERKAGSIPFGIGLS
jgi:hypothetical protein